MCMMHSSLQFIYIDRERGVIPTCIVVHFATFYRFCWNECMCRVQQNTVLQWHDTHTHTHSFVMYHFPHKFINASSDFLRYFVQFHLCAFVKLAMHFKETLFQRFKCASWPWSNFMSACLPHRSHWTYLLIKRRMCLMFFVNFVFVFFFAVL